MLIVIKSVLRAIYGFLKHILFCGTLSKYRKYRFYVGQSPLEFGTCHSGLTETEQEYAILNSLGSKWLRVDFRWDRFEKDDIFDFSDKDSYVSNAKANGFKIMAILDYDHPKLHDSEPKCPFVSEKDLPQYLKYVTEVINHFGDKIDAYEVWNEGNSMNRRFWGGKKEDFFLLQRETAKLISSMTDIPVAVGALFYNPVVFAGCFLRQMIKYGCADYADAISIHPYGVSMSGNERRTYKARKYIDKHCKTAKELWITEGGFPIGGNYLNREDPIKHGIMTTKYISRLLSAGSDLYIHYNFTNKLYTGDPDKIDSEKCYGLCNTTDYGYEIKPGGNAFSVLSKELTGYQAMSVNDLTSGFWKRSIHQTTFCNESGFSKVVMWSNAFPVNVKIKGSKIKVMDLVHGTILSAGSGSNLKVKVGKNPILVEIS